MTKATEVEKLAECGLPRYGGGGCDVGRVGGGRIEGDECNIGGGAGGGNELTEGTTT